MKVIINTPSIKESRGGVANHFKGLKNYWSKGVSYNIIGDRNGVPGLIILPFDLIKFLIIGFLKKPDIVVLNPSLGKTALKRDALYLKMAALFNAKIIVIFHGWNKNLENSITQNPKWFLRNFAGVDKFLVLSNEFRFKMQEWGVKTPIGLTSTKVDNDLLSNFEIENKKYNYNILFLARIEENKGIFTTIEAYAIVKKIFPLAKLTVAGEGKSLQKAKELVKEKSIPDIEFTGKISGNDLVSVFSASSIYILPTTHGEGMPTSILESMAFGLAVITRPVGGVKDFFKVRKMGFIIDDLDPKSYSNKIIELLKNKELLDQIGKYNHNYANEHFLASKVATSLEEEYLSV